MKTAAPTALDELRKALAVTSAPAVAPLPTGCEPLDAALGGGLPRGRLVELAGPWSSGKASLALAAAAQLTARRQLCAWVDGRGELYPPAVAALGVDLTRLCLVHPPPRGSARAAEIVARSGAFALVVIDLPDGEVVEEAAAGRLRAAAGAAPAAVVVLAPRAGALRQATVKLAVDRSGVTVAKGGAPMALILRRKP
jgi:RecA/RadA recombinase